MRYVWMIFLSLTALLLGLLGWQRLRPAAAAPAAVAPAPVVAVVAKQPARLPIKPAPPAEAAVLVATSSVKAATPAAPRVMPVAAPTTTPTKVLAPPAKTVAPTSLAAPAAPTTTAPTLPGTPAAAIVAFAEQQLGAPYCWAGVTPAGGFDCSGFIRYVFGEFDIDVPHSTALLINVGREVPRATAHPGDIVVFTGTAPTSTTPGHAGIVLSAPGEPLRFIHASSARRESGVKISTVEGSGYERRFMAVRRVL